MMRSFRLLMAVVTTLSIGAPQLAAAGPPLSAPGPAKSYLQDVALEAGNKLVIQTVDEDGRPHAGTPITVRKAGNQIHRSVTRPDGQVVLSQLKPGVYEISSGAQGGIYRLWAPNTAPPRVTPGILLIDDGDVVRGSRGGWQKAAIVGGVIITSGVLGGVIGYNVKDDAS